MEPGLNGMGLYGTRLNGAIDHTGTKAVKRAGCDVMFHLFEDDVDAAFQPLFSVNVQVEHLLNQSLELLWSQFVQYASDFLVQFLVTAHSSTHTVAHTHVAQVPMR